MIIIVLPLRHHAHQLQVFIKTTNAVFCYYIYRNIFFVMEAPLKNLISKGDINAFFGLMLDNVTNLVILTGILHGVFSFPIRASSSVKGPFS